MRLSRTVFMALLNATAASAQKTANTTPDKPTQTGTISTCNKWYDVVSGDTCGIVEQAFSITHAQFIAWNPAVSQDCSQNFWVGEAYCVGIGAGQPVSTTTKPASGLPSPDKPTQTGTASNCNLWYDVVSGDSCTTVEQKFGITHTQFISWNPAVSSDCSANFWIGNSYCVGVGAGVSSTTTTRTASGLPAPDKPTQTGTASNCNLWYDVVSGDSCTTVEQKFGITHAQFIAWNPAISSDCSVNFWIGNSYCVGTGKVASTVSTSTTSLTSQSSISIITPSGTYSALPDRSTTASVSSTDDSWPPTATQSGIAPNCELPSNTA
jgi:LysM repeat protein